MKTMADTKSPPLRFKDDSGNDYPEWEDNALEAVSNIAMGTSPKSEAYNREMSGLPLIQGNADIVDRKSAPRIYTQVITKLCCPDDVLISVRAPVGEISIAVHKACIGRGIAAIKAKERVSQGFLYQHLIWFEPKWARFSQGSTFDSINSKDLKLLRIVMPSVEQEQIKIAAFLSSIDTRIEQLEKKKSLFEQFKKGLMQRLFSQEIRFKDAQGNEYPEWEYKVIKEIGEIVTGKTPSTADKSLWNGNLKFITPTDISDARKYQANVERYIRKSKNTRIIPPYSIIYTCIASIGKICISTENCATNQQINAIIPFSGICNEYVYYCLLNATPRIKATQGNSTVPIINKSQFERIKLLFPCFEEQQKIAEFFSSIDRKIELISEKISQTRQFKKGLLQQMFV